jgi:DNA repair protein RecN (Recombination protein N)
MLRFLQIRRLAVIDSVEVEFQPGLNVLTGETGAGKSILVGAVGLLMGGRASGDLVRTGEELATVEAIFEVDGRETLMRREVTAQGRSRAFINGELATAGALKELSSRLVELHGQHEHQTLLDPAAHLAVLDGFGATPVLLEATGSAFRELQAVGDELKRARQAVQERGARRELATFQLGELEGANLARGEDQELGALRKVLASAERVERLCAESYAALYDSDGAILAGLGGVWRRVADLAALDPRFRPYLDAKDGIKSQLEDLAHFLRQYADAVEASPARLQQVEDRLALLERLKRKYGPTLDDAIARRDGLRAEVAAVSNEAETIAALDARHRQARQQFLAAASGLSAERQRIAARCSKAIEQELAQLAMERTRFETRFEELGEEGWTPAGMDRAEFFVSPNPGEDLRPLARIVSGGELSRIMLAVKTLTAASRNGFTALDARAPSAAAPGLIFDEVDAGIGGRVADVVGRKLRTLGSAFQVLCITHLPQIAAYADTHFQIEKTVVGGRTRTQVTRLTPAARVEEISRMLVGAAVTDGIRATAREMLGRRSGAPGAGTAANGESERAKVPPGARPARGDRKTV